MYLNIMEIPRSLRVGMLFLSACTSVPSQELDYVADRGKVASVLANHFETVFFANGAIFRGTGVFSGIPSHNLNALMVPFAVLVDGLEQHGALGLKRILTDGSVREVMLGAGLFHAPAGLGSVGANSCYVLALASQEPLNMQDYFQAQPFSTVSGMHVWTWTVQNSEEARRQSVFIAWLPPSFIIFSNDQNDLQKLIQDMMQRSALEPAPHLPEWSDFKKAPLWGYRRFRLNGPHWAAMAALSGVDQTASSVSFLFNPVLKMIQIQYRSSTDSDPTARRMRERFSVPFERLEHNLWSAKVPLPDDEQTVNGLIAIMSLFGLGLFL